VRVAAHAHWTRVVLSQGAPFFMRVERRFPALSSFLGQSPAQEIRSPSVGNRLISRPISDTITSAERLLTPGMVFSISMATRKGSTCCRPPYQCGQCPIQSIQLVQMKT